MTTTAKKITPEPPVECAVAQQGPVTVFFCGRGRRERPPPKPVPTGRPVELLVDAMPKPKSPPTRRAPGDDDERP